MHRPPLSPVKLTTRVLRSGDHVDGGALIVVLAFMVMLLGLVMAFFSHSLSERQVSKSSGSQTKVELFAQGAMDSVISDLKQEIAAGSSNAVVTAGSVTVTNYFPTAPANIVPALVSSTGTGGLENLVKCSANGQPSYPSGTSRACNSSTASTSLNGRAFTASLWNKPLLMAPASSTDFTPQLTGGIFTPPDWILVSRNGVNPTPYDKPTGNPMFTQYGSTIVNTVVQPYVQDAWQVKPDLTLQAGFKSSMQFATGDFPVQQKAGSISGGFPALPVGTINTKGMFLPQVGFAWDLSPKSQVFGNIQKNLRQFVTYGAGGLSPWSLSSQAAFDLFAATAQPETAVTYEIGYRGSSKIEDSFITEVDGQINLYHVDFKNRLLQIASTPVINTINPGNPILANVGGVKTDGLDIGGTLRFGSRFSFYNALSYNQSTYTQDYTSGATGAVVATSGKQVPGAPQWLEKFVLTGQFGDVEAQLVGDFVGKRYATYLNDLWVDPYFITSLNVTSKLPSLLGDSVKNSKLRLSITNLMDVKGDLNVGVGAVSGSYTTYPIAPRQFFLTYSGSF